MTYAGMPPFSGVLELYLANSIFHNPLLFTTSIEQTNPPPLYFFSDSSSSPSIIQPFLYIPRNENQRGVAPVMHATALHRNIPQDLCYPKNATVQADCTHAEFLGTSLRERIVMRSFLWFSVLSWIERVPVLLLIFVLT